MIRRSQTSDGPTVLFSGGGTVGHLSPGFALANELRARGIRCVFATPGEANEREWFAERNRPHRIRAPRIPKTWDDTVFFAPRMVQGIFQALWIIRRFRVGAVVALGGWPCVPAVFAASIMNRPLAFVVADAVPGLVVRQLKGLAGRIYVAFPSAKAALDDDPTVRLTGPLVRPDIVAGERNPAAFGLEEGRRTLLVLGGSLGSRGLFERWRLGLEARVVRDPTLIDRIQVIHSIGGQPERVRETYDRLGLRYYLTSFIQDMGTAYRTADLVLGRAGANTCAELLATQTPSVLVPYPHHADRQQYLNAEALVESGGAVVIEETDLDHLAVANEVIALLFNDDKLATMRAGLARESSHALTKTVDDFVRFIGMDDGVRTPLAAPHA